MKGYLARSRREDYLHRLGIGYSKMEKLSVAICCLVRDCERGLRANIPTIERLRGYFRSGHVVIVENDSKDSSKKILREWSRDNRYVHVLSEDCNDILVSKGKPGSPSIWFSRRRVDRMVGHRNKYLEYVESELPDIDIMIVIDLDLSFISIDGIAHTFGQDVRWDAVTSYGMKLCRTGYVYYDTFAFREFGDSAAQTMSMIYTYQKLLSGLPIGMPMIRVASGFNGMAIYDCKSIAGLRYRCQRNGDRMVEAVCEHVTFHQDMADMGKDHIYLNPSQRVGYDALGALIEGGRIGVVTRMARIQSRLRNKVS